MGLSDDRQGNTRIISRRRLNIKHISPGEDLIGENSDGGPDKTGKRHKHSNKSNKHQNHEKDVINSEISPDKHADKLLKHKLHKHGHHGNRRSNIHTDIDIYANNSEVYKLCGINFDRLHVGGPVIVIFHRRAAIHRFDGDEYIKPGLFALNDTLSSTINNSHENRNIMNKNPIEFHNKSTIYHDSLLRQDYLVPLNYFHPIRHVYYTESDQTVHYDSFTTFRAFTSATNDTTFFVGKRREKIADSEPSDYLGSLNMWRNCGQDGYTLRWPKENVVRQTG